jgi:hypothetical protein
MKRLWQTLLQRLTSTLRERVSLALTTMALRHQLAILQRSATRPPCRPADRCFWVLLSLVWSPGPEALTIVQPDTVRRWRRQGLPHHLRWWLERQRPGRPAIAAERRAFIRRMSWENALWGAPRIQGELAKLGVRVSRATIAKYRARRLGAPSPIWRTFLRHHADDVVASGVSAERVRRLDVSSDRVSHTLQPWLASWIPTGTPQSAQHDVLPLTEPCLTVAGPNPWVQRTANRIRVSKRSPPNPQRPCPKDPTSADVPRVVETAHVRLAA